MRRIRAFGATLAFACVVASACSSAPAGAPAGATPAASAPAAAAVTGAARFEGRAHGSAGAPVTVFEMSDFQCPFCRRFFLETYPALDSEYVAPGKVRWIFVNVPKQKIHPNSPRAAQFATCARRQGKFWAMHDLLFQNQSQWAPAPLPDSLFRDLAARAGLDAARLDQCLADPSTATELAADSAQAAAAGVRGVPSFVADGRIVVLGAQPVDSFRVVLEGLLKAVR